MEKGDQLLQLITGILDISRMEAGEMSSTSSRSTSTRSCRWRCRRSRRTRGARSWCSSCAAAGAAAGARRSRQDPPGAAQPARQRDQVHARGRQGRGRRAALAPLLPAAAERGAAAAARRGAATRASASRPSTQQARLRSVLPGRQHARRASTAAPGSGCRSSSFVEAHGGAVWVESDAGQGLDLHVHRCRSREPARREHVSRARMARMRPRREACWRSPLLLVASAFFAGSETALFSLSRVSARGHGARAKTARSQRCSTLLSQPAAADRHHHRLQRAHQHRQLVAGGDG